MEKLVKKKRISVSSKSLKTIGYKKRSANDNCFLKPLFLGAVICIVPKSNRSYLYVSMISDNLFALISQTETKTKFLKISRNLNDIANYAKLAFDMLSIEYQLRESTPKTNATFTNPLRDVK